MATALLVGGWRLAYDRLAPYDPAAGAAPGSGRSGNAFELFDLLGGLTVSERAFVCVCACARVYVCAF